MIVRKHTYTWILTQGLIVTGHRVNRTCLTNEEMKVMAIYYFVHSIAHVKEKTTKFSLEWWKHVNKNGEGQILRAAQPELWRRGGGREMNCKALLVEWAPPPKLRPVNLQSLYFQGTPLRHMKDPLRYKIGKLLHWEVAVPHSPGQKLDPRIGEGWKFHPFPHPWLRQWILPFPYATAGKYGPAYVSAAHKSINVLLGGHRIT